jgi:predicted enzyme related to lactoylglutathione lyase
VAVARPREATSDDRCDAEHAVAPSVQRDYNCAVEITGSDPVLAVHDLEGSAAWFCRVLGCERSDPDPGNWVFCRAGAVTFMLGRCPDAMAAADLGDHSYIAYLTVDSVDAYYAQALTAGATVLKPPMDEPWQRRLVGLRSPEGHRFMLGEVI